MNRRSWIALGFGLLIIAALTVLRATDPYPVQLGREAVFDLFQQIKPREAPDDLPIRIVDIDEASMREIGQWPWPRETMATLAERLAELGAAVIVFDVLFSEPDRAGAGSDARFAEALRQAPTVLSLARSVGGEALRAGEASGMAMTGADPLALAPRLDGVTQPLAGLADAATGIGVANLDSGGAGVARRLPLVWRSGESAVPALAVEALRLAAGEPTLVLMGEAEGPGLRQLRIGDFPVPTGSDGTMWLYYRTLPPDVSLPAAAVLGEDFEALSERVAGHIVLVGTSASGLLDIRTSALGTAVPGVSIHAQALEQILTGTFLDRADWVGGLEMAAFALAGLVVVLAVVLAGPMLGLAVWCVVVAAIVGFSWWAFAGPRLLIDPGYATLGLVVLYAAMAFFRFAVTDADRREIRRAFAHYVAPSLLAEIERDAGRLRLGGEMRELTVMFSDVRNFTALSERIAPEEMVTRLNALFGALGSAITAERGTIDKFMGDAVMAFWNAPVDVDRHALRACKAALGMRDALDALNRDADEPVAIGIGIATGPALVGNMGFEERFNYSCVGDTVNVASRLEGQCRRVGHDILVTAQVAEAAPELAFLSAGAVALKGKSARETIFVLVGDEALRQSEGFSALARCHAELINDMSAQALSRCREAAAAVDPRLVSFYEAMAERAEDFAR